LKKSCYRSARRRVGRLRAVAAGLAVGDSRQRPQVRSARNDDGQGARAGRESPSWLAGPLNPTLRGPPAQMVPPSGSCSGAFANRQPDRPPTRDLRVPGVHGPDAVQDRKRQESRAESISEECMALNLSQKQEVVAELADVAAQAHSLVAAEYAGTTVAQMTAMRKKAREEGVFLKVVKNTLAARAVEGTDYEVVKDKLVGPLLYAFSTE